MLDVKQHVAIFCHVDTFVSSSVIIANHEETDKYFESTTAPAKRSVSDRSIHAGTTARDPAILGPRVDSVPQRAEYDVHTPAVLSLAQSRVHHARRFVPGSAPTLANAICPALSLATNCHARSVVS